MKWSLTIAKVSGIRIRVHVTFLLLLAFLMWCEHAEGGWGAAAWIAVFVLSTFTCVALHELGHSLVAQRLGVKVSSITLLPIGGVAALRSIPRKPAHEIAITVAGPLVNVLIVVVLYAVAVWVPEVPYFPGLRLLRELPTNWAEWIGVMLLVNKWMIAFNLIPAYPMDGGRLFRALLACWLPYARATRIAAAVGKTAAAGFVVYGLFATPSIPFLVVIGVMIFFAAGAEEKSVRFHGALEHVRVEQIMTPVFITVGPGDAAGDCAPWVVQRGQDDFPVMEGDHLIGLLTREAVLEAARDPGKVVPAVEAMTQRFPCTRPDAPAAMVHEVMQAARQRTAPVIQDGRLVGLLTLDNINRYCAIHPEGNGGTRAAA